MEKVAIVGAGPGGLIVARYLKGQGFDPVMFEAHSSLGGQWNNGNPSSGVWPLMRTNTARMVTRFSDLDYPENVAIFPRNQEVRAYLEAFAEKFDLTKRIHFDTRMTALDRDADGWKVTLQSGGETREETYGRVVVATGAYNRPSIPQVEGLDAFSGDLGAIHAFDYSDPEVYRGKRVLVAGGNISSLEIASDLAMLGAERVGTAMRRQRYVMPKLIAGTPVESYGFTRAAALFQESASSDELAASTKEFVLTYGGNPAWYGAPEPDADVRKAKTTGSQNYLNLVAEDRMSCHPWFDRIDGRTVHFTDGTSADYDGIIFGTGYKVNLPFLSDELRETLEVTDRSITLSDFSFHPDAPGLAIIGQWGQIGPYLPSLELQARYVAYTWGETIPAPDRTQLEAGCENCRASFGNDIYQHTQTIRFARLAGVDPHGKTSEALSNLLDETSVTAITFRLTGPESLPDAEEQIRAEARKFGRKDLQHV